MAWEPDYTTDEDLAEYLGDEQSTIAQARLELAVAAASRVIDQFTGRQFGLVDQAEARTYELWPDYERGVLVATIDDLMDTDGLTVEVDGTVTTAYRLEPRNAVAKGRPYEYLVLTSHRRASAAAVTAKWGWSPTWPATVTQATLLQAARFVQRGDAPFGILGSPDGTGDVRLLAKVDPDVAVMLANYRRMGAVA